MLPKKAESCQPCVCRLKWKEVKFAGRCMAKKDRKKSPLKGRNEERKKVLVSIAGFDPGSGAGITLDLAVFRNLGYFGAGLITGLTVQNTQHVKDIFCPPADFLRAQYSAIQQDLVPAGIKVGMLGCQDRIPVVRKILSAHPAIPRVVDPVFQSSSGAWLLDEGAIPDFIEKICRKATVITPNLHEASRIAGFSVRTARDMQRAAEKIYALTGVPCLVKGGHLEDQALDILFDGASIHIFRKEKLGKRVHGTGCVLSSSLLCHLAQGLPLEESCRRAKEFTHESIKTAVPIGRGQNLITSFPPRRP